MADDFSRAVARVVAAQLAEAAGFEACQDSAVEILADLLLRYLSTLAASAHGYAELAGRSQFNLADALLALEDVGVTSEDLHHHLQLQGGAAGDLPFAHALAPYPVVAQQPLPPTFADRREPHPAHVPPFLPAFPDPHTYQHTAVYPGHEGDPHKQRQSMLAAKQKAEAALNKLHMRMAGRQAAAALGAGANPFAAPPTVQQLPPLEVPQKQQRPAAGAAAAGAAGARAAQNGGGAAAAAVNNARDGVDGDDDDDDDDEDALFESAALLKAFGGLLPAEVLAREAARAAGDAPPASAPGQQQQQRRADADGVLDERQMDIDDDDGGGAGGAGGAGGDGRGGGTSVGDQQQQQQQQQAAAALGWRQLPGDPAAPPGSGEAPPSGAAMLRFGLDPLADQRAAAAAMAGGPPGASAAAAAAAGGTTTTPAAAATAAMAGREDAYPEHSRTAGYGAGARQRKSRYDADPRARQAEALFGLAPEQMFAHAGVQLGGGAAGGGDGDDDEFLGEFDDEEGLDD